jgi:hypothetical protein
MYKNIKITYQRGKKETKETSETIDTHTQKKTIVVLSSSINKIEMLKETVIYLQMEHTKKKDR